jgi:hypothetical protein
MKSGLEWSGAEAAAPRFWNRRELLQSISRAENIVATCMTWDPYARHARTPLNLRRVTVRWDKHESQGDRTVSKPRCIIDRTISKSRCMMQHDRRYKFIRYKGSTRLLTVDHGLNVHLINEIRIHFFFKYLNSIFYVQNFKKKKRNYIEVLYTVHAPC